MFFFATSFVVLGAAGQDSYEMITDGRCEDHTFEGLPLKPVTAKADCERAAKFLLLRDTSVSSTSKTERPEGCYYTNLDEGRSLWFADDGTQGAESYTNEGHLRKPLCKRTEGDYRKFQMITTGKCKDHGLSTVVSKTSCALAAEYLSLRDKSVSSTSNTARPEGCYYTNPDNGSSLWFAEDGTLGYDCCNEHNVSRKPICEIDQELVSILDIIDNVLDGLGRRLELAEQQGVPAIA